MTGDDHIPGYAESDAATFTSDSHDGDEIRVQSGKKTDKRDYATRWSCLACQLEDIEVVMRLDYAQLPDCPRCGSDHLGWDLDPTHDKQTRDEWGDRFTIPDGDTIQQARERLGLSRPELAAEAGLPRSTLYSVEQGSSSSDTLSAVCETLRRLGPP